MLPTEPGEAEEGAGTAHAEADGAAEVPTGASSPADEAAPAEPPRPGGLQPVALIGVLMVAATLRLARLGPVPPPLPDEVLAAVDIRALLDTGRHFTGALPGPLSWVIPVLDGRLLIASVTDPTVEALRSVAALYGVGTVALVALAGRELRLPWGGLVGAAALAVMPWHVHVSRLFFPASAYLFMTALSVVALLTALRKRSLALAVVAALAATASFYLYPVSLLMTPALLGPVVVLRRRELRRFGVLGSLIALEVGALAVMPYVLVHLRSSDSLVSDVDRVIAGKLLWNQGLPAGEVLSRLLANWASYFTPDFVFLGGDPNVAHSTRSVGALGVAIGIMGCAGLLVGLVRRLPEHKLLLVWTVVFPLGGAVTAVDARGNTVRAVTGSLVWALWAAVGAAATWAMVRDRRRPALAVLAGGAVALQTAAFSASYFGPYGRDNAQVFEVGYDRVLPVLEREGVEDLPVYFLGGYERRAVLDYFSGYRLSIRSAYLSCQDLPIAGLGDLDPPAVVVVRDDPGFEKVPTCRPGSAVARAASQLRALEAAGRDLWDVRSIDVGVNDAQGRRTAVFVVRPPEPRRAGRR